MKFAELLLANADGFAEELLHGIPSLPGPNALIQRIVERQVSYEPVVNGVYQCPHCFIEFGVSAALTPADDTTGAEAWQCSANALHLFLNGYSSI